MGFGASTIVGNMMVDLVQTDVDGIVDGIAGSGTPKTLADIDALMYSPSASAGVADLLYSASAGYGVADLLQYSGSSAGYLLYNMESYLSSIQSDTGYLSSIQSDTSYLSSIQSDTSYLSSIQSDTSYLYSSSAGYGVADLMYDSGAGASAASLLASIKTAVETLANAVTSNRLQVDDQH